MRNTVKLRFFCWLILTILLMICFAKLMVSKHTLNTNVMDLLPSSHQNSVTQKAANKFYNTMEKQLIVLVGNPDKENAQKAADQWYDILQKSPLFQNIRYRIDIHEQEAWAKFYFPYRLSLLPPNAKKLLQNNDVTSLQNQAMFHLYSPMGIVNSQLLQSDPYFLFQQYLLSLPKPASKVELHKQRMMISTPDRWYVMITFQTKSDSFSIAQQNKIVHFIRSSKAQVLKAVPNTHILMSGMLFYAKAGADVAQRDISTIGIGSLIGIILLLLLTFRSLSPLLFTLMSGLIGFMSAFVVTQLLFGSIYLFTLVFGASLIGIAVDYAFFYYSEQLTGGHEWNALQGLKNILPGISLGLLNIVLAYLILSFTPFPGLRQLAVFAITGLTMAYLTVVCFFPMILKPKKPRNPFLLKLTNCYLHLWQRITLKRVGLLYLAILVFSAIGIYQLQANDDIHKLESVPTYLKNQQDQIKDIIGSHIGMNFYIIQGNTPAKTLENEKILTYTINQNFPAIPNKYIGIQTYIPTISEQTENFDVVQNKLLNASLTTYLEKIGVPKQKAIGIKNTLSRTAFKPLTVSDWINSPVSQSLRYLWLDKIENQFATVLLLSDQLDPKTLKQATQSLDFATYINKAEELSQVFKVYRTRISILLAIIYIVLFLLLLMRYAFKRTLFYFAPPLGACLLSLAVLGWLHIPLTLFNLFALILVLGIGVDYVLFFAETQSTYSSTMLAVSLSAIATTLSFGLLALSATPVIHYFGITVLIGIISAFILSPLATRI